MPMPRSTIKKGRITKLRGNYGMGLNKKRDFQYARNTRDKAIQQDIFSDYKKPIMFNLILGALFLSLSLAAMFVSSEIKDILLLTLIFFAGVLVISSYMLIKK